MSWSEWADTVEIEPSLYASDFSRLGVQLETLQGAGARVFHFDVGDGHFIPEVTIGPIVLASISPFVRGWGARLDCHLMVAEPERHFEAIARAGGDSVTFHVEACDDPPRAVAAARSLGSASVWRSTPRRPSPTPWPRPAEWISCSACPSIRGTGPGVHAGGHRTHRGASRRPVPGRPCSGRRRVNRQTVRAARDAGADLLVAGSAVFWSDDPGAAFGDLVEVARA